MSIEKRHLVTGALLAFVVVTGVTLAVKETRHARAVAAASRPAATLRPRRGARGPRRRHPRRRARTALAPPLRARRPRPARPRRARRPGRRKPRPEARPRPSTIYVTYFHATARCASCLKIEDLTNATMTTRFAGPIAEKRVVWRLVNLDEPEHAHYVKDYGLYTKSVVVTEVKEVGRCAGRTSIRSGSSWRPCAFQSYVEREVRPSWKRRDPTSPPPPQRLSGSAS